MPAEIGDCQELQKLMLAGNRLTALPANLANCTKLELLRIAANQPHRAACVAAALPRLAWLAYAGNPFSAPFEAAAEARHPIGAMAWQRCRLSSSWAKAHPASFTAPAGSAPTWRTRR